MIQDELFDCDLQKEISEIKSGSLNVDQQAACATVMQAVHDESYTQGLLFLNAPGSYGKTFLIEVLLATVRCMVKIVLDVASSGIADELLKVEELHIQGSKYLPQLIRPVSSIKAQSDTAKLMRKVKLVISDGAEEPCSPSGLC